MPAPVKRPAPAVPTVDESPTVGVELAGEALGIRSSKSYLLARTGELCEGVPVIKVGAKYRVPTASLRRRLGLDLDNT